MARILIVDDDPVCREILRETLQSEGHRVADAGNFKDAVARAQSFSPDVLITDVWLNESASGADVAHAVASECPGVGVLVISGLPAAEVRSLLRGLPVSHFLEKPLELDDVVTLVEDLVAAETAPQKR